MELFQPVMMQRISRTVSGATTTASRGGGRGATSSGRDGRSLVGISLIYLLHYLVPFLIVSSVVVLENRQFIYSSYHVCMRFKLAKVLSFGEILKNDIVNFDSEVSDSRWPRVWFSRRWFSPLLHALPLDEPSVQLLQRLLHVHLL